MQYSMRLAWAAAWMMPLCHGSQHPNDDKPLLILPHVGSNGLFSEIHNTHEHHQGSPSWKLENVHSFPVLPPSLVNGMDAQHRKGSSIRVGANRVVSPTFASNGGHTGVNSPRIPPVVVPSRPPSPIQHTSFQDAMTQRVRAISVENGSGPSVLSLDAFVQDPSPRVTDIPISHVPNGPAFSPIISTMTNRHYHSHEDRVSSPTISNDVRSVQSANALPSMSSSGITAPISPPTASQTKMNDRKLGKYGPVKLSHLLYNDGDLSVYLGRVKPKYDTQTPAAQEKRYMEKDWLGRVKGRPVVVKVTPISSVQARLLTHEGAILSTLQHPNVVINEGVISSEKRAISLFSYYEQETLGDYIMSKKATLKKMKPSQVRQLFYPIVQGGTFMLQTNLTDHVVVAYMHSQGVAHRKLSSRNIFITGDSMKTSLLTDFRYAYRQDALHEEPTIMSAFTMSRFVAPELLRSRLTDVDPFKMDVWSIGVMMLSALLPSDIMGTRDVVGIMIAGIHGTFRGDLRELLDGLLASDPNKRWTMDTVLRHPWWNKARQEE